MAKTNINNKHLYDKECKLRLFLKKEEERKKEEYNNIPTCSVDEVKKQIALLQKNKKVNKINNISKKSYKIFNFFN